MGRHTSGNAAGYRSRFTTRTLAAALLVAAVSGGSSVSLGQGAESWAEAGASPLSAEAAERRAEIADRIDRRHREAEAAAEEAAEQAESGPTEDEVRRAAEPEAQPPEPPPPPPPPPASGGEESGGGTSSEPAGPVPDSCSEYSGNRATGCTLLLEAGFGLDQMSCLDSLWNKESGWNHQAQNPSSGAYGIPQALPGDKMASHGDDWRTNPVTQIRWGLSYISDRYGTPCSAWSHSQANNWY